MNTTFFAIVTLAVLVLEFIAGSWKSRRGGMTH
jgi:hypothetical protein